MAEQKQMNWTGGNGLTSPFPMTADEFAARLRQFHRYVRVVSDTKITIDGPNGRVVMNGKRG